MKKKTIDPFKKIKKSRKSFSKPRVVKAAPSEELILATEALDLIHMTSDLKLIYQRLDAITQELIDLGFESIIVGKYRLVLKDNFATKNLAWKSTPMRRFQLELA